MLLQVEVVDVLIVNGAVPTPEKRNGQRPKDGACRVVPEQDVG